MTTKDLIRYDLQVQSALRGVVRKVLSDVIRDGLPGDHHFYISFRTGAPGVRVSTRVREKYPEEMTIVLQHQFWDLTVTEHSLEVGLSFSGIPERLLIPFDALTGFFDPSVQFGLKFEIEETMAKEPPESQSGDEAAQSNLVVLDTEPKGSDKVPADALPTSIVPHAAKSDKKPAKEKTAGSRGAKQTKNEGDADDKPAKGNPGADVVSLDAFRKKP